MNKTKAKLVTVVIFTFVVLTGVDLVAINPAVLPWVLAPFALVGAWKFCRVCYIWLITETVKNKTYKDWAQTPGGSTWR